MIIRPVEASTRYQIDYIVYADQLTHNKPVWLAQRQKNTNSNLQIPVETTRNKNLPNIPSQTNRNQYLSSDIGIRSETMRNNYVMVMRTSKVTSKKYNVIWFEQEYINTKSNHQIPLESNGFYRPVETIKNHQDL